MRYSKKNAKRYKMRRSRIQSQNNNNTSKNNKKLQNKANIKVNRKRRSIT